MNTGRNLLLTCHSFATLPQSHPLASTVLPRAFGHAKAPRVCAVLHTDNVVINLVAGAGFREASTKEVVVIKV